MVRRVFVEKKAGFDVEAVALAKDLRENLGLETLKQVRIFNRYDVEGIEEAQFLQFCEQVFAEPAVDTFSLEEMPAIQGVCFGAAYLPGQYDQRADSAAQCMQLISQQERPTVRTAKIYALEGLRKDELEIVKAYLINPVDSCEIGMEKPNSLAWETEEPQPVAVLDHFIDMTAQELDSMHEELGLAMSKEDLAFVRNYFEGAEKRNPTISELRVIDTYWSDHCRHTTFLTELKNISILAPREEENQAVLKAIQDAFTNYRETRAEVYGNDTKRPMTLMDMAVIGAKKLKKAGIVTDLDESEEINACSIRVSATINGRKKPYLVMFKNETHNHPTEIEPFGGAATCLGGAIRDPLSGRSYVYQAMRITGSGDPREATRDTLAGKLPQRKITTGAAAGYSSYGNQIGLATGLVREIYHEGYKAKRMEIGAVIAAAPEKNVVRSRPISGDKILLIGGRTGRDGIGGATGSSKAHTEESIRVCGAQVQKGNPITERKLQRLFRQEAFAKKIKRCNDFGAGGVCVAIGELAAGLCIDLDAVPKKYDGLDGTELAVSESQERMAIVVDPKHVQEMIAMAEAENLECTPVAVVTEKKRLVMTWRGQTIIDIDRAFLDTNGCPQYADAQIELPNEKQNPFRAPRIKEKYSICDALQDLNHCSQRGLGECFDSTIGAGSVLLPFGGKYQRTHAQAMASLIPSDEGASSTATLMSYGFDPYLSEWSPMHGASYAVLDSLAKIVASGGEYENARLTFQEYFERLEGDPVRWGKPAAALLGALQAQLAMNTPAIGGKDSMSGTFQHLHVPPTLVSFAVAPTEAEHVVSNEFKRGGHDVVLFPVGRDEADLPDYASAKGQYKRIARLLKEKKAVSAAAVSTLLSTVANGCFGNRVGFSFVTQEWDLRCPLYGSIVVEMKRGEPVPQGAVLLGHTTDAPELIVEGVHYDLSELEARWEKPLESIFPTRTDRKETLSDETCWTERNQSAPAVITLKPQAVIPVLPGTNCEYDTANALEIAGAKAKIHLIKNANSAQIERSVWELAQQIAKAQMLILPGGFSGGDEPDGSAKFLTALLRAPQIQEEIHALLHRRDGLILGICNGFQALIKSGLLPYGEIRPMRQDSPTLTYNEIGRHVAKLASTRVTSVQSPWLSACHVGDVYQTALSHGEGRFVATKEEIRTLFENGQIATQYVDEEGKPSMDSEYNPNGSYAAVEGICSPDGRVLGKMGHVERIGKYLYRNVPHHMEMNLFESGVLYFRGKQHTKN